jgi:hypothetical protein
VITARPIKFIDIAERSERSLADEKVRAWMSSRINVPRFRVLSTVLVSDGGELRLPCETQDFLQILFGLYFAAFLTRQNILAKVRWFAVRSVLKGTFGIKPVEGDCAFTTLEIDCWKPAEVIIGIV